MRDMSQLPGAIFIIDPKREHLAVHEARRLKIPTIAIVDTNCDPDGIDFVIPANDDAIRSIRLIAAGIADAAIEGLMRQEIVQAERAQDIGRAANVGREDEEEAPIFSPDLAPRRLPPRLSPTARRPVRPSRIALCRGPSRSPGST